LLDRVDDEATWLFYPGFEHELVEREPFRILRPQAKL